MKKNNKSISRRTFIKNVALATTGIMMKQTNI